MEHGQGKIDEIRLSIGKTRMNMSALKEWRCCRDPGRGEVLLARLQVSNIATLTRSEIVLHAGIVSGMGLVL